MDIENIMSYISTIGFPIVCCIFMWRFINSTLKEFRDSLSEFKNTVSENTRMMTKLCDRLEERRSDHE